MGFDVTGGAEARYVAGKLYKAAGRELTKELRAGNRKATRPLEKAIKAEALETLPRRGGYNRVMARAVKVSITGLGLKMRLRVYARGKAELRDVVAVNAGRLRHPVHGNRNVWRTTFVRPGFVWRPTDRLVDDLEREALNAAERVLEQIART